MGWRNKRLTINHQGQSAEGPGGGSWGREVIDPLQCLIRRDTMGSRGLSLAPSLTKHNFFRTYSNLNFCSLVTTLLIFSSIALWHKRSGTVPGALHDPSENPEESARAFSSLYIISLVCLCFFLSLLPGEMHT